jgi:hypothetical protein
MNLPAASVVACRDACSDACGVYGGASNPAANESQCRPRPLAPEKKLLYSYDTEWKFYVAHLFGKY